ncbi:LysR substrate-binding domain-containing protein [Mesorhizobium sp. NPDC059054]|uniref:LysR substrate-binding domain-containing protein n=1 Tax=Mesorhizobium sp. NPDC059054 TaxID=3346711 RepID=UPI0036A57C9F
MIEIRLLRQFVAVAEELHFHRAAERLHMAQPPLSQAIRRLEAEIGAPLFVRNNRNVALTLAGVSFLETARNVLGALETGVEQARRVASGTSGSLKIVFVGTLHFNFLPRVVQAFRSRLPDVELTLREATTNEQIAALKAGLADIGLMRRPGVAVPELVFERIAREGIVVALPEGHAQAAKQRVPLAALAEDDFIATPRSEGMGFYDQMIALCNAAGFSPRIVQEARQIETITGLVAGGLGIALVPASVRQGLRDGIVFRQIVVEGTGDASFLDVLAAWDASRPTPARDKFLDIVRTTSSLIS